jgi:hypothetical protein
MRKKEEYKAVTIAGYKLGRCGENAVVLQCIKRIGLKGL